MPSASSLLLTTFRGMKELNCAAAAELDADGVQDTAVTPSAKMKGRSFGAGRLPTNRPLADGSHRQHQVARRIYRLANE